MELRNAGQGDSADPFTWLLALGSDLEDNTTQDLEAPPLYKFLSFNVYGFCPSPAGPLKRSGKGEGKKNQCKEEEEEV